MNYYRFAPFRLLVASEGLLYDGQIKASVFSTRRRSEICQSSVPWKGLIRQVPLGARKVMGNSESNRTVMVAGWEDSVSVRRNQQRRSRAAGRGPSARVGNG